MIRPNTQRHAVWEHIKENPGGLFSAGALTKLFGFNCDGIVSEFVKRDILKKHCGSRKPFGNGIIFKAGGHLFEPKPLPVRNKKPKVIVTKKFDGLPAGSIWNI